MELQEALLVLAKEEPNHPLVEVRYRDRASSEHGVKEAVKMVEHVDFSRGMLCLESGEKIPFDCIVTLTGHAICRAQRDAL